MEREGLQDPFPIVPLAVRSWLSGASGYPEEASSPHGEMYVKSREWVCRIGHQWCALGPLGGKPNSVLSQDEKSLQPT